MAQLVNSWREDRRTFKHKNPQKKYQCGKIGESVLYILKSNQTKTTQIQNRLLKENLGRYKSVRCYVICPTNQ